MAQQGHAFSFGFPRESDDIGNQGRHSATGSPSQAFFMSRPNTFQQTTQLLKSQRTNSLEHKLGLYQVFQRLYDTNPSLLDELISLENLPAGQSPKSTTPHYIIGNCTSTNDASLTTNLLGDRSQTLYQTEQIWLLGRAPNSGIYLEDARLSRYHAAIQFSPNQGFELVDLGSTNGSFVNGEAVRHRQRLKEGDHLRLGSLSILFFEPSAIQQLPKLSNALLEMLGKEAEPITPPLFPEAKSKIESPSDETMAFLRGEISLQSEASGASQDNDQSDRQARLLERLKQIP